jgi:hypothetical protein
MRLLKHQLALYFFIQYCGQRPLYTRAKAIAFVQQGYKSFFISGFFDLKKRLVYVIYHYGLQILFYL